MTHIYSESLDEIVKANKIYRIDAELSDTLNDSSIERKDLLRQLLTHIQSIKSSRQINEEKIQQHINILKHSQYQKKWQFLTSEQKYNRLQEFINRKNITDCNIMLKLKECIDKSIIKTKHIKYNIINALIDDILILKMNECNSYYIEEIIQTNNKKSTTKTNDPILNDKKKIKKIIKK